MCLLIGTSLIGVGARSVSLPRYERKYARGHTVLLNRKRPNKHTTICKFNDFYNEVVLLVKSIKYMFSCDLGKWDLL